MRCCGRSRQRDPSCPKHQNSGAWRMHARQTDGTQRETIKRLFSARISIVLKYLLLKIKLRLKSQHAVQVFYESRNC